MQKRNLIFALQINILTEKGEIEAFYQKYGQSSMQNCR
jgi:hypothetical protein